MGLESASFISDLVATNPVGATDPKSQGDDHLRLIKATVKATFPNITGAMNASQAELNHVVGVSSGIQTQLNGKAATGHNHAGTYEPAFVKSTGFNKDFGTTAGTVTQGNDARLSDARAPLAHNHAASNINSGTLADARLPTSQATKQFTSIELGHASDTTLARAAAGKVTVEGKALLRHQGSFTSGQITVGTGAASGGSDGDIHLKV